MLPETLKLYENDAYITTFTATVLECAEFENGYSVVLNQTAFFAEGGGQKADEGTINGINVLDVIENNGVIFHKVQSPLKTGDTVSGEIDWSLRYRRMQSHTGEHILSGVTHRLFGLNNVGFHMSEKIMSVDFDGKLNEEDIRKIELLSNEAVYKNAEIIAYYPAEEELKNLDYRSKLDLKSGVRIVNIKGVDLCACCAPHLKRTGEVGLIKIVDFYPNKQGTRIEMLAGISALEDYINLNQQNKHRFP